jgi:molybdopterin-guanine dinucleotide biosynthesis protein A
MNAERKGRATPFAAALIAGGQSRRMGRDKAWLDWHGEPLWQVQLRKLEELHPSALFISCREEQRLDSTLAAPIHDPPDNQGPLPALARCLERAQMPVLALAVDMPHVTVPLLRGLMEATGDSHAGAVYRGTHGYEPLCALYPLTTLPLLRDSLARGNLRLQSFVDESVEAGLLRVIPLSKEQEALFLNLNTPDDLA